ncbi:MAG: sigma-70 family RNA polymerase sigma factor [Candidatus Eisenbacteria bacterium]|nr:sigma-70 family RNA polymerase sigma factor [Candidatus Eisenbacteria bacterium]
MNDTHKKRVDGDGGGGAAGTEANGTAGGGDRGKLADVLLMREVASGNEAAFARLVDQHNAAVLNTCYRILGNREDAEDAALDVFVQVHRNAGSFRGESRLSTWLYRISVNLSLNLLRKQRRDRYLGFLSLSEPVGKLAGHAVEAPESHRPDRELEVRERSRILDEALATLPDKQRAAIVLHKCERLSQQEIADVLEVTSAAVESLIHRARQNLQKRLLRALGES